MAFMHGHALIVAVADYPNIRRLPRTVLNDGRDMYALLTDPEKCGYLKQNAKLLLNQDASRSNIMAELDRLVSATNKEDIVIIYFSGHGGRVIDGPFQGNYLLPYDTVPKSIRTTTINGEDLTKLFRKIKVEKLLVIFDCCHSGGTAEPKSSSPSFVGFKSGFSDSYYDVLKQGSGRAIIASSLSSEESLVLPSMPNSLFTYYLLRGLAGEASSHNDGVIRVLDLFHFISEKVPCHDDRQHPLFKGELKDNFPISLYNGGNTKSGPESESKNPPMPSSKYHARRDIIAPEANINELNIINRPDENE